MKDSEKAVFFPTHNITAYLLKRTTNLFQQLEAIEGESYILPWLEPRIHGSASLCRLTDDASSSGFYH